MIGLPVIQIVAGAAVVAALGAGVQTYRLVALEAQFNEYRLVASNASLAATQKNRMLENQLTELNLENRNALDNERESNRMAAAAFERERSRLRNTISDYAAGRGLTSEVAASTCSERSKALGRSLDATLSAEESLVSELENQRADTRTLLRDARAVREIMR